MWLVVVIVLVGRRIASVVGDATARCNCAGRVRELCRGMSCCEFWWQSSLLPVRVVHNKSLVILVVASWWQSSLLLVRVVVTEV